MSAAPVSFYDFLSKSIKSLRLNPSILVTVLFVYVGMAFGVFLYVGKQKESLALRRELERQENLLTTFQTAIAKNNENGTGSVDVFKRLTFSESQDSQDQDKLQAALSLNSFARYALDHGDTKKAKEILSQSLQTHSTIEGKYYLGVANYLEGRAPEAAALWTQVSDKKDVPKDIYLYLSMAEYKAGNTEASKKYAELFSKPLTK
jgi:hypothetical protein